ncbi:hypothetical protein BC827DRAFT_1270204 [Russula dissimulans]|nr:hypothetical protein BC827DRAFT_1270204 [Russula dissimulans]
MSTATAPISPPEEDLKAAIISLKERHPTLGITKLHTLLLSENPGWTVSEKRLRRILKNSESHASPRQHQGLESDPTGSSIQVSSETHVYPSSTLIEGLNIAKWTAAVEVKYFDKKKGKGLVAKEPISEGQFVWKEDPFIIAPEWEIYDLQLASRACAYCTTPLMGRLSSSSSLVLSCSSASGACAARFCNRLCLRRSEHTHPLLCPAQNPASVPLLSFSRKNAWMALHALAQCTARLLLAYQKQQGRQQADGGDEEWHVYSALADLGMEERAKGNWLHGAEPDRTTWQAAHNVFVQAFVMPLDATWQKKLGKLLKRPLPKEVADALFTYDGFLHGLGRMSLNLEAHGGLYTLHSHLNHSCDPNISVRHLDQRTALSRITAVAKRDIAVGEELVIA